MIELAQHIEALLLENDCVIVPGLGGFVGHYTPAVRVAEENRFLPPARVIGFNPSLKMNDGLLVQSYASVYGTSFSDATHRIDQQVSKLKNKLQEDGKVELANIGELHCSVYGSFSFVPYDTKLTTPYLYGWQGFEMHELKVLPQPAKTGRPEVSAATLPTTHRRRRTFHNQGTYIRHAIGAVAAVLLFFLLSTPIENTGVMEENYAHLMPSELFERLGQPSLLTTTVRPDVPVAAPQKKRVTPVAVKEVKVKADPVEKTASTVKAIPAAKTTPAVKAEKTAEKKVAATDSKPYHIIVASVGTEQDAKRMAERLRQKGFSKASAIIGNGKMRVSIQTCSSQAEAYKVLKEIRAMEAYQSAWVLH